MGELHLIDRGAMQIRIRERDRPHRASSSASEPMQMSPLPSVHTGSGVSLALARQRPIDVVFEPVAKRPSRIEAAGTQLIVLLSSTIRSRTAVADVPRVLRVVDQRVAGAPSERNSYACTAHAGRDRPALEDLNENGSASLKNFPATGVTRPQSDRPALPRAPPVIR